MAAVPALNERRIIRPGCFVSSVENPLIHEKCQVAGRCNLAKDCMWTKDEMELRKDPRRGADTTNMNTVLRSR